MDTSTLRFGRLGPDPEHKKALFAAAPLTIPFDHCNPNINYNSRFGPIRNQGQIGDCVTFACLEPHELKQAIHLGIHEKYSEWALYSMTKHLYEQDAMNEEGLYTIDALMVLSNYGPVLDSDFPTANVNEQNLLTPVPTNLVKADRKVQGYMTVPKDVQSMYRALCSHGPEIIGITWYNDWFNPVIDEHGEAWLTPKPQQGVAGGHDLKIVGGSLTKVSPWGVKGAFLLRNQWGPTWGKDGCAWLPFDTTVLPDDIYTIQL